MKPVEYLVINQMEKVKHWQKLYVLNMRIKNHC